MAVLDESIIERYTDQQIQGRSVEVEEADTLYVESMAHAMKTAQASVVSDRLSVIWRLLGYMRPYKGMAALGMLGAVMMTMLSLIPRVLGFGITGPDISVGVFVSALLYMGMYFQPIDVLSPMPMVVNRATSSAIGYSTCSALSPKSRRRPIRCGWNPCAGMWS